MKRQRSFVERGVISSKMTPGAGGGRSMLTAPRPSPLVDLHTRSTENVMVVTGSLPGVLDAYVYPLTVARIVEIPDGTQLLGIDWVLQVPQTPGLLLAGLTISVIPPLGGNLYTAHLYGDDLGEASSGSTMWVNGQPDHLQTGPGITLEVIAGDACISWDDCSVGDLIVEVGVQDAGLTEGYPGEDLHFSVRLLLPEPLRRPRVLPSTVPCL